MALYSYIKMRRKRKNRIVYTLSFLFISLGLAILVWTLFPIIIFEIYYAPKFGTILRPISNDSQRQTSKYRLANILGLSTVDYTRANIWFPQATIIKTPTVDTKTYSLDIPKLKINTAQVVVGGDDLSKSLIHFTGPLPGNKGNPVILGHSTLLWLYNPKNYKSIFSRLPDLEVNDEIIITVDQIQYTYIVSEMYITTPDDLSPLEQTYDYQYLTLITCVPQGTYLKRFIVKGRLLSSQYD